MQKERGIDQLTKTNAVDIVDHNIRLNAVTLSSIGTDLVGEAIDDKTQKE